MLSPYTLTRHCYSFFQHKWHIMRADIYSTTNTFYTNYGQVISKHSKSSLAFAFATWQLLWFKMSEQDKKFCPCKTSSQWDTQNPLPGLALNIKVANFIQVSLICISVYFTFTSQSLLHNSQLHSLWVSTAYCTVLKCWAKEDSIKIACWQMSWLGQIIFRASHFLIEKIQNPGDYSVLKYAVIVIYKKHFGLTNQIYFSAVWLLMFDFVSLWQHSWLKSAVYK